MFLRDRLKGTFQIYTDRSANPTFEPPRLNLDLDWKKYEND